MRGSANLFCTTDGSNSNRGYGNSYFKKFRQGDSQDAFENDNQQLISVLENTEGKQSVKNEVQSRFSDKYKNEFSGGFAKGEDFFNNNIHVRHDDFDKSCFESHPLENAKRCPIQTMARQQYRNYNMKNDSTKIEVNPKNNTTSKDPLNKTLKDPSQSKLQKKEKEKLDPKLEALIEMVEKQEMNSISLLNETSGKLRQKIEYTLTEGISGRTKVFECVCLFGNQIIGKRKGNTKQNAKSEAAKQGLRTLLTEKKFLTESAALILSIQKAQENVMKQKNLERNDISPFMLRKNLEEQSSGDHKNLLYPRCNTSEELSTSQSISSMSQEKILDPMKSSLYELNVFARRLVIEPVWIFPFEPNAEGYFEVSLQFGSLIVTEYAKRKQDAKKEAAAVMIRKIKEAQNEGKSFFSKAENVCTPKRAEEEKSIDKARAIFEKAMKPKVLKKFVVHDQFQNVEEQTEQISILNEDQLKSDVNQNLEDFFHKIENYTSMITSNPKQIMLDEEKHLADYVKSCYLTPIGSFALGCMRTEKLVIDAVLSFDEVRAVEEKELLELYKYSLQTCYALDQESGTNIEHMEFSFSIENELLQIKSMGNNCLTLNILILKQSQERRGNLPIQHIHDIYSHLNGSLEELRFFRKLLRAIRTWREKYNLTCVNIEMFDITLLAAFLMVHSTNLEKIFARWCHIFDSPLLTLRILKYFDREYLDLYTKFSLDDKIKSKFSNVSRTILS